jgi:TolB-like protein
MEGSSRLRVNLTAWAFAGALFLLSILPTADVKAAVPLEDGVTQLAAQIVANSQAKNLTSIAIVPFVNTDGSYSELSNFLVDELVLKLFTVPGNNMRLIERQQLGAMLAEMALGWADVVSAESTQHLGKVHGVQGLVIGSITDMNDSLRITARLIETETGGVFSAAAINVAKSPTVQSLLSRRIALSGYTASQRRGTASPPIGGGAAQSNLGRGEFANEFLRATVSAIWQDESKNQTRFSLLVENLSASEVRLMTWRAKDWAVLVDDIGMLQPWHSNGGFNNCPSQHLTNCSNSSTYTPIPPQGFVMITITFGGTPLKGDHATLSVRFLAFTKSDQKHPINFTLSIADVPLRPQN